MIDTEKTIFTKTEGYYFLIKRTEVHLTPILLLDPSFLNKKKNDIR